MGVCVVIGDRLRQLREAKRLSQGDIERRSGLLRCYVSRVENGYTVPSVETLEKFARAIEIPMYQLFYDGDAPPRMPKCPNRNSASENHWEDSEAGARQLKKLSRFLSRMDDRNRKLLFSLGQKIANSKKNQSV